jgi:dTDP-4-dehydrorhamnose reductase
LNMVKTAVIGASGFIGRHLLADIRREYPDAVGTACTRPAPGLAPLDLRRPVVETLRLAETGHRAVVVAAGITDVGRCQATPDDVQVVNVTGTIEVMRQLAAAGLRVVFLSTDYVFAGDTGGYGDEYPTHPTTIYGQHKVQVEAFLRTHVPRSLVLRLSKTFGHVKGDGTMLDEMAACLTAGRAVRAATDQVLCPTAIDDLVPAIRALITAGAAGVMNLAAPEVWSRHAVAQSLCKSLGTDMSLVEAIRLHDLPSMAFRPCNTSLRCDRLRLEAGITFRPLQHWIGHTAASWCAE